MRWFRSPKAEPTSASYSALGEDPAGVEASLRRAQEAIRVIVAPSLAVEVAS